MRRCSAVLDRAAYTGQGRSTPIRAAWCSSQSGRPTHRATKASASTSVFIHRLCDQDSDFAGAIDEGPAPASPARWARRFLEHLERAVRGRTSTTRLFAICPDAVEGIAWPGRGPVRGRGSRRLPQHSPPSDRCGRARPRWRPRLPQAAGRGPAATRSEGRPTASARCAPWHPRRRGGLALRGRGPRPAGGAAASPSRRPAPIQIRAICKLLAPRHGSARCRVRAAEGFHRSRVVREVAGIRC